MKSLTLVGILLMVFLFSGLVFAACATCATGSNAVFAKFIKANSLSNAALTVSSTAQVSALKNTLAGKARVLSATKNSYAQKLLEVENATAEQVTLRKAELVTAHKELLAKHSQQVLSVVDWLQAQTAPLSTAALEKVESLEKIPCLSAANSTTAEYLDCSKTYKKQWWIVKKEIRSQGLAFALKRSHTALQKAKSLIETKIIPSNLYKTDSAFKERTDKVLASVNALLEKTRHFLGLDLSLPENYHPAKRVIQEVQKTLVHIHAWLLKINGIRSIDPANPAPTTPQLEDVALEAQEVVDAVEENPALDTGIISADTPAIEAEQELEAASSTGGNSS